MYRFHYFKVLTWSHYSFKQRLLNKAREHPWCKVLIVDEHYTSKTCGFCGKIDQKLGGKKIFKCHSCKIEADRDIHAARNILLRFLTLNKEPHGMEIPSIVALGPNPVISSEIMQN